MARTPLLKQLDSASGEVFDAADDSRDLTDAERAAGIIPVNYAYLPGQAARQGVSSSASAATNATGLQAAINALPTGGGTVDITDGDITYNTGLTIPVNKHVKLRGIGGAFGEQFATSAATRLIYTGSGNAITGTGVQSTSWVGLTLQNIELEGSGATGHGIEIISGNSILLDNSKIHGFTSTDKAGLRLSGGDTQITVVRKSVIEGNYRGIHADKGAQSLAWTQLVICDGSQVHYNTNENVLAQDGSSFIMRDSYFNHGNAGAHWIALKNVRHHVIQGCHGELSGAASNFDCIYLDAVSADQCLGGIISGNEIVRSNQTSGTGTCVNYNSARGCVIEGNRFSSLSTLPPITVGADSRDIEIGRNYWNTSGLKLASINIAALGTRVSFLSIVPFYFQVTNVAASQTDVALAGVNAAATFYRMPNTAWVVGIGVATEANVTAGTMLIEPLVSGVAATTTLTLNSSNAGNASTMVPPLQDGNKIASGGSLRCQYTTDAGFLPDGSNDMTIVVYVAIMDHATNTM